MAGKEQGPRGVEIGQVIHYIHEATPGAGFDQLRVRKGKGSGDVESQVVLTSQLGLDGKPEVKVGRGKNEAFYTPDGDHKVGFESHGYTDPQFTDTESPPFPKKKQ